MRLAPRESLHGEKKTEVLIVGGGLAGILSAWRLSQAGVSCIVAEAKTLGSGVTGNTTAKITAQHGLIYAGLLRRFGLEMAQMYYAANTRALEAYRKLAASIPCELEQHTAYVYSKTDLAGLEREAAAYQRLNIPYHMQETPPLPFPVRGALGMENQAQFHPLKLLAALTDKLEIYENTFVRKIENGCAFTESGRIRAKHILLATHYPLVNIPGLYFIKLYQQRSYVLALKGAPQPEGMYVDDGNGGYSFRSYRDFLLLGGGGHKTGKPGGGFPELARFAGHAFPDAEIKYHWATQDCMTLDSVPYIGRHRAGSSGLYVATGFNKWGMTGCMAAAELLCDLILHGKSDWEALYSPRRRIWTRQLAINAASSAVGLLSIGEPRCTHMGCKLHFNREEGSWDCACHGSRFDKKGNIINNPAKRGLKLKK